MPLILSFRCIIKFEIFSSPTNINIFSFSVYNYQQMFVDSYLIMVCSMVKEMIGEAYITCNPAVKLLYL